LVNDPSSHTLSAGPVASFEVVWAGDVVVIRAKGEIDAHTSLTLDTICESLIVPGLPLTVRLDAAQVKFIDCGGVRGVVAVSERIAAAGGSFAVTSPSDRVAWLLDRCHVDLRVRTASARRGARRGVCRTRVPRTRPAA
jgi:anti-anti-sigma factor